MKEKRLELMIENCIRMNVDEFRNYSGKLSSDERKIMEGALAMRYFMMAKKVPENDR